MIVRIRYKQLGGHVHCRMFVGQAPNMTFAKSGEFVLSAGREWDEFRDQYQSSMEFWLEDAGVEPQRT